MIRGFSITLLLVGLCNSLVAMSLAEKIALAKKMADDGVSGKAESGLVVNSNFNFSDIVKKYRIENKQTDVSILEEQPVDVKKEAIVPQAQIRQETQKVVDVAKKETPKPSLQKPVKEVARKDVSSNVVEAKSVDKKPQKTENKLVESIIEAEKLSQEADKLPLPKVEKTKPKYEVDTSNFVNGHISTDSAKNEVKTEQKNDKKKEKETSSEKITEWNNKIFAVYSDDPFAVFTVRDFANEAYNIFTDFYSAGVRPLELSKKIVLKIISNPKNAKSGTMEYSMDKLGNVVLSVAWDEHTDITKFCRLLAGSVLRKAAYEKSAKVPTASPYWLDVALGVMLQSKVEFAYTRELAEFSAENHPATLTDVLKFSANKDFSEKTKADAYWTLRTIERLTARSGKFWNLLMALPYLKSENVEQSIKAACNLQNDTIFDARFVCTQTGEIFSRIGGVQSVELTRSEISRLAIIQAEDTSGEPLGLRPSQTWTFRKNSIVADNLDRRIVEIKITLPRANPIYAESLARLGEVFEAIADDDEDAFTKASYAFQSALKKADAIANVAKVLLGKKSISADKSSVVK